MLNIAKRWHRSDRTTFSEHSLRIGRPRSALMPVTVALRLQRIPIHQPRRKPAVETPNPTTCFACFALPRSLPTAEGLPLRFRGIEIQQLGGLPSDNSLQQLRPREHGSDWRGGSCRAATATMMSSSSPPPPASLPAGSSSLFRGYTKLCKGLAIILLLVHLLVQLFPSAVAYLALIPSRTIPFTWNLITAGYVEQTIPGVVVSIIGLLSFGKLLEPLWGSKELSKFIFIVNFSTSACVFITAIALYYITQQESYLYTPLSGFYGVLSGLLVGIKQLLPDQELNLFVLKIKGKWIPSLVALISVVVSFFVKELVSYLPILLFGIYMSWIYLRYFQKRLETGLKGDPSEEFSFSSFFPEFLRPILDPIASIFHTLLCGRSEISDGRGQTLDTSPLPGSDSIEANRRRERGQRALEQRLAEKLAAVRSPEGTPLDAADKV